MRSRNYIHKQLKMIKTLTEWERMWDDGDVDKFLKSKNLKNECCSVIDAINKGILMEYNRKYYASEFLTKFINEESKYERRGDGQW